MVGCYIMIGEAEEVNNPMCEDMPHCHLFILIFCSFPSENLLDVMFIFPCLHVTRGGLRLMCRQGSFVINQSNLICIALFVQIPPHKVHEKGATQFQEKKEVKTTFSVSKRGIIKCRIR